MTDRKPAPGKGRPVMADKRKHALVISSGDECEIAYDDEITWFAQTTEPEQAELIIKAVNAYQSLDQWLTDRIAECEKGRVQLQPGLTDGRIALDGRLSAFRETLEKLRAGGGNGFEKGITMSETKRKPKFKVGQVVRINTEWYAGDRKGQQYQRITDVWPWPTCKKTPWGYSFVNGDECNEKYIAALTKREAGGDL